MEETNYRLEGLTRRADEIVQELKEGGLMGCDIEVIGAILFTKYKGENARIEKLNIMDIHIGINISQVKRVIFV